MWRAWQCCVSLLLVGVLASVAGAQTNWVGKTILLKRCDIKIGQPYDQSTQTYVPTLALIDYQVLTEEAGRVKVKTHHGTEAWLDKGDVVLLENAADYFTKQLQDNGGNADTYCCRACAWMLTNEFKKGLADFDTALRLDPRARVHFIRGTVWFRKQHYDKAIADFNEAIRLDPKLSLGYNSRAVVWQAKMDNEKAIADCSAAIRIDPKLAVAYLNRGNICYAKNEKDKAIADYSEAVRVDPSYAAAYYNRADAWFDKMDYDKAIADYDEALRIEPKNAAAYCNRGATWQEKKEYGKAIADYDKAVGLNPSLVFCLWRSGLGMGYVFRWEIS